MTTRHETDNELEFLSERRPPVFPPRWVRRVGGTLWPSFLTACAASIVFFANVDPATLNMQTLPGWELSRMTGYSIGFLMFWGVGLCSSMMTFLLTDGKRDHS